MNKLILNSGGHPLFIEDLNHLQEALRGGFESLANMFLSPLVSAVILSGCEVSKSGATLNISDGVVYFNGEIWKVHGADFLPDVLSLGLKYTPTFNNPSSYIYADGNTYGALQVRELHFVTESPEVLWSSVFTIQQANAVKYGDWQPFGDLKNGVKGSFSPRFRQDVNGLIHLNGQISVSLANLDSVSSNPFVFLYEMGENFKPDTVYQFTVGMYEGENITLSVRNDPKGSILLYYPVGFASNFLLNLSGINFLSKS